MGGGVVVACGRIQSFDCRMGLDLVGSYILQKERMGEIWRDSAIFDIHLFSLYLSIPAPRLTGQHSEVKSIKIGKTNLSLPQNHLAAMHFLRSLALAITVTLESEFPHLLLFRLSGRGGIVLAPRMGDAFRDADNGRNGGYDGEEEYHFWRGGRGGFLFEGESGRMM